MTVGWFLIVGIAAAIMLALSPTRKIRRIAEAIAKAEGYGVPNAIPTVRNNPGNLKDPKTGEIRWFPTPADGWNALYQQVLLMLTGESRFYKPEMTISEIARVYVGDSDWPNWARNVAAYLGVTTDTRLRDV